MPPLFAQREPPELTGLVGWVADVISRFGEVGVGLLIIAETLFPPIPSEAVLPLGGYLASSGELSLLGVVVASTVGSLVGAWVLYGVGARLGPRTDTLVRRLPLIDQDDLDRARAWFDNHGGQAVFFGRFIPGVRSLISLPAGMERMGLVRFSLYTLVGSAIWNIVLVGAGWTLGDRWENAAQYSDWLNYAVYATVLAVLARFLWLRRDRIRARRVETPRR